MLLNRVGSSFLFDIELSRFKSDLIISLHFLFPLHRQLISLQINYPCIYNL